VQVGRCLERGLTAGLQNPHEAVCAGRRSSRQDAPRLGLTSAATEAVPAILLINARKPLNDGMGTVTITKLLR